MRRMCRSCNIPSTHHNPWQPGTLLSNPILSYLSCVHFRRFLMEGDDVRPGPRRTYLPRGLLSSSVYESTLTLIANDTVETESGLDRSAFEKAIEKIPGGGREKVEKIPLQIESEGANSVGYRTGLEKFGDYGERAALDNIWRR